MGSVIKVAGGVAAAMLIHLAVTPSVANAQPIEFVPCSTSRLITAIADANNAGGRILRLAPICNYVLDAVAETGNGPSGLPIIRGNITLLGGPFTRISRVSTAPAFRLIEVVSGATLTVRSISLTGGNSTGTGGAIRNSGGTVELFNTTVAGNRAQTLGGGLDNVNPGRFVINASLIRDNTAATVNGGGMFNDGSLSIGFSHFTGNTATVGDGGGLRNTGSGQATISQTTFDRNTAANTGGGISIGAPSRLELSRSVVIRNQAGNGGGVFVATGATLTQNGNLIRFNSPNDCVGAGCTSG